MTSGFGMGFFGRHPFDMDARKKFREEWSKMTDSEKLECANKRMEMMGQDHFSVETIDARCAAWMKMTPEEKILPGTDDQDGSRHAQPDP